MRKNDVEECEDKQKLQRLLEKFCKLHDLRFCMKTGDGICTALVLGKTSHPVYFYIDSAGFAKKWVMRFSCSHGENGLSAEETACKTAIQSILEASRLLVLSYYVSGQRTIDVSNVRTLDQLEILCDLGEE